MIPLCEQDGRLLDCAPIGEAVAVGEAQTPETGLAALRAALALGPAPAERMFLAHRLGRLTY